MAYENSQVVSISIDLKKSILAVSELTAFSHSLGQKLTLLSLDFVASRYEVAPGECGCRTQVVALFLYRCPCLLLTVKEPQAHMRSRHSQTQRGERVVRSD